ncbi:unnamed protein product [Cuscuta europaea]|uniref:J domain-containing protein n=1 Tax=Cuscuta europaea TaxID=41803 RepID=A0A9P0ZXH9_CUSEU|nr:unnamed protein product [Cuscuta europaea]
MECYKGEAFRAKELAEKKVLEKDFAGARVSALKAQNLFPGLNGLSELLDVINIYVNFEKTTNGEVDWYAVLGVDDEKLRRYCAKIATSVHPDYNHSCGANGAFRIIMQAWSMFADHAKRATYDRRRRRLAMVTSRNVFRKYHATSKVQLTSTPPQPPMLCLPGRNTFWTKCSWCNMQFQYSTVYLHKLLICVRCHSSFWATEERSVCGQAFPSYPSSEAKFFPTPSLMRETPPVMFPELNVISCPNICDRASNGSATVPSSAQANAKALNRKRRVDEWKLSIDRKRRMMTQIRVTSTAGTSSKRNDKTKTSKQKLSHSDVHNVLIGKAVLEIKKKLDEWKATNDEG